jgi:alkylation response protein AidB-like acyl-CoA dehydrogenase
MQLAIESNGHARRLPAPHSNPVLSSELRARTLAGELLIAQAEALAVEIAPGAALHDREGSFPFESFDAVKDSGYLAAPIPVELGGLGVTSVHDVVVAASRLARGDAALTLGVNMHHVYVLNVVRRWQQAVAGGDARRAAALGESLARIAHDGTVFAAASSEPGQDLTRPSTSATRTEDGWIVSGRKIFCTMSPAADILYASVTFVDRDGDEKYGYALIPRRAPGVTIHGDWDALGMRASASHTVTFDDVRLPASALRGGFPVGDTSEYLERNLNAGLFHAAAALGIAEAAVAQVIDRVRHRAALDARTEILAAENTVDLSAGRAVLARAATLIDEQYETDPAAPLSSETLTRLFVEAQSAKTFIGEASVRIVDRALALSGGAGYVNGSALARAYRDVRATAFMHPLGANRAYSFLGQVATGRQSSLH